MVLCFVFFFFLGGGMCFMVLHLLEAAKTKWFSLGFSGDFCETWG